MAKKNKSSGLPASGALSAEDTSNWEAKASSFMSKAKTSKPNAKDAKSAVSADQRKSDAEFNEKLKRATS